MSRSTVPSAGRDCAGFSLIEVVVTLAVLAVVLVSIGKLVGVTVRGIHALQDHLALVETARAIETGLGDRRGLQLGTTSGQTGAVQWRIDAQPFPADTQPRSRWEPVSETITLQATGGTRLSVSTLRLRPKASQ